MNLIFSALQTSKCLIEVLCSFTFLKVGCKRFPAAEIEVADDAFPVIFLLTSSNIFVVLAAIAVAVTLVALVVLIVLVCILVLVFPEVKLCFGASLAVCDKEIDISSLIFIVIRNIPFAIKMLDDLVCCLSIAFKRA
jgi:hypothetical protein